MDRKTEENKGEGKIERLQWRKRKQSYFAQLVCHMYNFGFRV
jgi:hypothetical protein